MTTGLLRLQRLVRADADAGADVGRTIDDDDEPPVPAAGASERERDVSAMAWLAWWHRRNRLGSPG